MTRDSIYKSSEGHTPPLYRSRFLPVTATKGNSLLESGLPVGSGAAGNIKYLVSLGLRRETRAAFTRLEADTIMTDNRMIYVRGAGLTGTAKTMLQRIAASFRMNESETLRRLIADDADAARSKRKVLVMMQDSGVKTKTCCFRFGTKDMENLYELCDYYNSNAEDVIRHLILDYYSDHWMEM